MDGVLAEWAGEERPFRLAFGGLMDLEEACGKVGFGEIYLRLGQHRYFARDVYHTIRLGLIGGGMTEAEAKRLMTDRFDATPMVRRVELALTILLSVMEGIKPAAPKRPGDPKRPLDTGKVLASLIQLGLSPEQVRAMRYADYVNLLRASGDGDLEPPTQEEFEDMVRRFAPEAAT